MNHKITVSNELKPNRQDRLMSLLGSVVGGYFPVVGTAINEVLKATVPNQLLDRIIEFATILDNRLGSLEHEVNTTFFRNNKESITIIVEAIKQITIATSDDRIRYLASIVLQDSLPDNLKYDETKRLLQLLNELTDSEIIILRYYQYRTHLNLPYLTKNEEFKALIENYNAFKEKYNQILKEADRDSSGSISSYEKNNSDFYYLFKQNLIDKRLLVAETIYEENGLPEIDAYCKQIKTRSPKISSLGDLFLEMIGILKPVVKKDPYEKRWF